MIPGGVVALLAKDVGTKASELIAASPLAKKVLLANLHIRSLGAQSKNVSRVWSVSICLL